MSLLKPFSKVALITGSARGIGASCARRLAKDGFAVAISDLPSQKDLADGVIKDIESAGGQATWVPIDVTKRDQVFAGVDATAKAFGGFGLIINNAGIAPAKPLLKVTEADVELAYQINVHSVLWGIQAAAEKFIEQGSKGKILSAASIAALNGYPLLGVYCATKFSVRALTQAAAQELAPQGITVNAYAPGVVSTPMWESIDEQMSKETGKAKGESKNSFGKAIALGRFQEPEDVANLVSFFASEESSYITGQTFVTDGGIVFH